jgi:hypothetical protein
MPESTFAARARRLPTTLEQRRAARRARFLERRTATLIDELGAAPSRRVDPTQPDMSHTMRVAWELLATLRGNLLSLEERATRVVPAEVAALVALWTQLHTLDPGAPAILGWAAWGTLLVAILVLAGIVMPSRLARFWDNLVPPELVLAGLRPLSLEEEAAIASHLSKALHTQIDQLRRGFRLTVVLSAFALVLAALAYVLDKT